MTAQSHCRAVFERYPFATALALSLAFHGAALAGALWLFQGDGPLADRPQQTAMVVIETVAPPAVATSAEAAPPKPIIEPAPAGTRAEPPPPPIRPARLDPPPPPKPLTPDPTLATAPPEAPFAVAPPPRRPAPPARTGTPDTAPPDAATAEAPPDAAAAEAPPAQQALAQDTAPVYGAPGLANPRPRYPWIARQKGEQGRVVLRVTVDAEGRAVAVAVARSSGHGRLDRAAVETIGTWRFEPARAGGRAVAGSVDVPVSFRLSDG